jgi:hypothetical protein
MPYIVTLYNKQSKLVYLIGYCKKFIKTDFIKYDLLKILDKESYNEIKLKYVIKTSFINEKTYSELDLYVNSNTHIIESNIDYLTSKPFECEEYNPMLFNDQMNDILEDAISLNDISEIEKY